MDIGEKVVKLETQMETALAGIANFRDFQREARDFFSRSDERDKERAEASRNDRRRLNILIAIAGLIASVIIATCAILTLHASEARSVLNDLNLSTSQYHYDVAERSTK